MEHKAVIEYKDFIISGKNYELPKFSLKVNENDIIEIDSKSDGAASLFIRGISTLNSVRGDIFFSGSRYNPMDYEKMLQLKRNIGYLGPLCALLSNRSVIENIVLHRLWEENTRKIKLDESLIKDCELAGISEYLYKRPEKTTEEVKCGAYLVREFLKEPRVIFLERPYLFTRGRLDRFLWTKLNKTIEKKAPVVFFSTTGFVPSVTVTHKVIIEKDKIEKIRVSNGS